MDQRESERHDERHQQAHPGGLEGVRGGGGGKGTGQHLAFEPDIDDPRPLRPQAGEAGEDQRHGKPDGGGQDLGEKIQEFHDQASRGDEVAGQVRPECLFERAHEQDDQALDHDDHVARDGGPGKREFRSALIEQSEQHGREHHAHRMRTAHERNGDADEAGAADKLEHQAVLHAQDLVDRHAVPLARRRSAWR